MPAYDFRCLKCGSTCEVVRPAADRSPVSCPTCGGDTKRVFTPVGVAFKGSGFYNTDYKNKPAAKPETACPSADSSSPKCGG